MSEGRTVYITGITGRIGQALVKGLPGGYALRGSSRSGTPVEGAQVRAGAVQDRAFMLAELAGVDTVIHLAADPSPSASWDAVLRSNIDGTYAVYEAARQHGVRRVVFASTNHVTGILTERWRSMDPSVPIRPDGYYGVSKACGEALGRLYADRHGISSICLRIGWYFTDDEAEVVARFKDRDDAYPLMWLSEADLVEVHRCAVEAEGVDYGIYYAMSANTGMLWDMENTHRELGYSSQDNLAEVFRRHGVPYDFAAAGDDVK